jgi:phage tail sheath protein FI
MPEYLAPGVFVEETSFREKSIEGVGTSTTGFVGPCRFGPINDEPSLLTSFAEFQRIYGGVDQLEFSGHRSKSHNYLAQAVRAYFAEGGARLYVARTFSPIGDTDDGIARWSTVGSPPVGSPPQTLGVRARYPGAAGEFTVNLLFKRGQNILGSDTNGNPQLKGGGHQDVVWAQTEAEAATSPPGAGQTFWVQRHEDTMRLRRNDGDTSDVVSLDTLAEVRLLTVSVTVSPMGQFGDEQVWEDLTFDPAHPNSLASVFAATPSQRSTALYVPLIFESDADDGVEVADALTGLESVVSGTLVVNNLDNNNALTRTVRIRLANGNDGQQPTATEYEGDESANGLKSGLLAFEDLEEISIIAAPGSTHDFTPEGGFVDNAERIMQLLITHCERMRYRVAVLDSIDGQLLASIREMRGIIDTTRAALYYPWIRIFDPITNTEILNPPSGHITGIYARNDIKRGVHKSPANEVIRLSRGYENFLNKGQQEVLNPEGVNCLRFFEGRGYRVGGARTTSSDPEWKYLNVRRFFAYLERSIKIGTQWAMFANNGEKLWANVRSAAEVFLFNEWKWNRIAGDSPEQAFFVRCDRTTMSQNDLDNGRMICLIGVAPLRPAEFVIFRIGQKTRDSAG